MVPQLLEGSGYQATIEREVALDEQMGLCIRYRCRLAKALANASAINPLRRSHRSQCLPNYGSVATT